MASISAAGSDGIASRIGVLDSLAQTLLALVLMCANLLNAWHAIGQAGRHG